MFISRAQSYFIAFLIFLVSPSFIKAQNGYYDLESITKSTNTDNRYMVTSNTLKVRVSGQYHKNKAGAPFYTLKKGDIVSVWTAREGKFAGKNSKWFEINYYDPETGLVVYPPNRKPWYPRTVSGIVDGKYLKELKKTFFTVNNDYSKIKIAGRESLKLQKGDTIIAEELPYKDDVKVFLVRGKNQVWFSAPRAGGGSTSRAGFLDNSILIKIPNQESLNVDDFEVTSYISESETRSNLFGLVNQLLFVFLLIGTIIFILISWNRPKYSFDYNHFKIDKKQFFIDIIKGTVIDLNRYQKTSYSSTPGRAYQSGNTVNFTAPKVNVNTSNHREIWIKDNTGREHLVTRDYDINTARVGSMLTWLKLQNGFTLGLLYHNLGKYNYTRKSVLKNVIYNAVSMKFNFVKFGIVVSLFGFGLYSIVNFVFFRYHQAKELFDYKDATIKIASFPIKTYYIQFFCFSVLLLVVYFIVLSIKRRIAIKTVSKKLEKDIVNLCEKLI